MKGPGRSDPDPGHAAAWQWLHTAGASMAAVSVGGFFFVRSGYPYAYGYRTRYPLSRSTTPRSTTPRSTTRRLRPIPARHHAESPYAGQGEQGRARGNARGRAGAPLRPRQPARRAGRRRRGSRRPLLAHCGGPSSSVGWRCRVAAHTLTVHVSGRGRSSVASR